MQLQHSHVSIKHINKHADVTHSTAFPLRKLPAEHEHSTLCFTRITRGWTKSNKPETLGISGAGFFHIILDTKPTASKHRRELKALKQTWKIMPHPFFVHQVNSRGKGMDTAPSSVPPLLWEKKHEAITTSLHKTLLYELVMTRNKYEQMRKQQ